MIKNYLRTISAVAVLGVGLLATAVQANTINMGYETTSTNPGHNFIYDTTLTDPTLTGFGTVDFFVDVNGTRYDFADALFSFDGVQTGLALGTFPVFDGWFIFATPSEQVIVSGQFTGAVMSAVSIFSGAVFGDSENGVGPFGVPSDIAYLSGPAFPVSPVVILDPQDFSFTLNSPKSVGQGITSYDTSFAGNAEFIPEPATLTILATAVLCMVPRRRRNSH